MKARCPNCAAVYRFDSARIPDKGICGTCRKCKSHFLVRKTKVARNGTNLDSTSNFRAAGQCEIVKRLLYKNEIVESTVASMDDVPFKKVIKEGYEQKRLHLALTNLSLIIFSESNEKTYYEKYLLDEIVGIETNNCIFDNFSFITKQGERRMLNFDENSRKTLKKQIIPKVQTFLQGRMTREEEKDFRSLKASLGEPGKMGNRLNIRKILGGTGIISASVREAIEKNITPNEEVLFCLVGEFKQAIVAFKNRLLVVKPGFMAGVTFGARVTTFLYKDITSIKLNAGQLKGVIEISDPSHPPIPEKDWWSLSTDRDPERISNCFLASKMDLKNFRPYLAKLKALIANVKKAEMISQIEKMAGLYQSGDFC
jgi:predicted Zn finger-like uncharacterized protein